MSDADPLGKSEPPDPSEPSHFSAFASFFKSYMSISAVVAAALPIPVASFELIPMYAAQRAFLGLYAGLFCFLTLAFIFYRRHSLARVMFGHYLHEVYVKDSADLSHLHIRGRFWVTWSPAILVLLCFAAILAYQFTLENSLSSANYRFTLFPLTDIGLGPEGVTSDWALKSLRRYEIPFGWLLMTFYLLIFLFAEVAFVFMAIREYLQDLLDVSEIDQILWPWRVRQGNRS